MTPQLPIDIHLERSAHSADAMGMSENRPIEKLIGKSGEATTGSVFLAETY